MHSYFLGIGGAGIGPLAQLVHQAGYQVSGSDRQSSSYLEYLKEQGISQIEIGDSADLITKAHQQQPIDWLVYSSAVAMDPKGQNQLEQARALNIKCTKRDQYLSQFLTDHNLKMLAIAGTHGKTTTTAMLTWLFLSLDQPISYLLPAKVSFGPMANFSQDSPYFIYEADEFDHNFLAFKPLLSIIPGLSWDHHEIYLTEESYQAAFRTFLKQSHHNILWQSSVSYLGIEGPNLQIESETKAPLHQIALLGRATRSDAWLAVCAAQYLLKLPVENLLAVINNFPGLSRRMEEIAPNLFSDYAHTPDKVKGAMSTASELAAQRGQSLVVIYEPLTNRRQIHMLREYRDCFKGASHLYWLPSYLAREDPKDRIISPRELISNLSDPSIAEAAKLDDRLLNDIKNHLQAGNMVVAMAGGGAHSLDDWLRDNFITPKV